MYRVRGKWLANVGQMYRVRGKWLANVGRMYRVRPIFQNGHFGEYSNLPKLANFWRVLEFDKFAGEWPLLKKNPIYKPRLILNFELRKPRLKIPNICNNSTLNTE